ncbi:hypothetical protein ACFPYM_07685, partial [Methylobacterium hispanicum]
MAGGRRPETGEVRGQIATLAGISHGHLDKINAVYDAAERDPELFGPVVAYLERSGNTHDAHRMLRRVADLARVKHLARIAGVFATLVLDPPWQDESVSANQRPPYATKTTTEAQTAAA